MSQLACIVFPGRLELESTGREQPGMCRSDGLWDPERHVCHQEKGLSTFFYGSPAPSIFQPLRLAGMVYCQQTSFMCRAGLYGAMSVALTDEKSTSPSPSQAPASCFWRWPRTWRGLPKVLRCRQTPHMSRSGLHGMLSVGLVERRSLTTTLVCFLSSACRRI